MLDNFKFETFVDAHSNIFEEYLSSVISKLRETDTEKSSNLSEQECAALIEILELRARLCDMQLEAIYFRGCYDSVGYLKKAGIL